MWSAPLHNQAFIKEMLEHVEDNKKDFATHDRIKGMLTVALNVRLPSPSTRARCRARRC